MYTSVSSVSGLFHQNTLVGTQLALAVVHGEYTLLIMINRLSVVAISFNHKV